MQEDNIHLLANKHIGKTCYIIGSGTSILKLTEKDFEPECPIIAINMTIPVIEKLKLDNPIYSMQKDTDKRWVDEGYTSLPIKAILLVNVQAGVNIFPEYLQRYGFISSNLGVNGKHDFSAIVALKIAEKFGCVKLKLMGFDSCWGDIHNFYDRRRRYASERYGRQMTRMLRRIQDDNLNVEWIK